MSLPVRFGRTDTEDVQVACLSTDAVGDPVCMRDEMTVSGRWRVEKADCLYRDKMPAVGILISKSTPTTGVMRRVGPVEGIFSGFDVKEKTFIGKGGGVVQPPPIPDPGETVRMQRFGLVVSNDILWLTGEVAEIFTRIG